MVDYDFITITKWMISNIESWEDVIRLLTTTYKGKEIFSIEACAAYILCNIVSLIVATVFILLFSKILWCLLFGKNRK